MASEKSGIEKHSVPFKKPNYMLMSLQRIFVLSVILVSVVVVVYYTPMPGKHLRAYPSYLCRYFRFVNAEMSYSS